MRTILLIFLGISLIANSQLFSIGFQPFNSIFNNIFSITKPLFDNISSMTQKVHKTFEQLQNFQKINEMANGRYGITLAFYPTGRVLLIANGQMYECDGYLDVAISPKCNGYLRKFKIHQLEDYCYTNNYINDDYYYCLSSSETDSPLYSFRNGQAKCIGLDSEPTLLLTKIEYQQLCNGLPNDILYKYYPNDVNFFDVIDRNTLGCLNKNGDNNDLETCLFRHERKIDSPYHQYTAIMHSQPGNYKTVMIRT